MKKILVTGIGCYIGSCLFYILKKKFKVIGIDKKKSSNKIINQCNILDYKKLNQIIKKEKPELIIHLAAQSLVDETINKKKYYECQKIIYYEWCSDRTLDLLHQHYGVY